MTMARPRASAGSPEPSLIADATVAKGTKCYYPHLPRAHSEPWLQFYTTNTGSTLTLYAIVKEITRPLEPGLKKTTPDDKTCKQ